MKDAQLPQGVEKVAAVDTMFDTIAPRYDLLNRMLTFGMDIGWRKKTVASLKLPANSLVLDLACGTGDLCRVLTDAGLRPIGVDRSAGMLGAARTDAALVRGDAMRLPVPDGGADGVVCGFALRNVLDLGEFFVECARVLRPGGRVALLEVCEPANPVLRAGHSVYFNKVVPLVGGLVFYFVIALLLGLALIGIDRRVPDFPSRAKLVVIFAVAASAFMHLSEPIFYHHDWPHFLYLFVGDALMLSAAGLIIARWFLPKGQSAPADAPTEA